MALTERTLGANSSNSSTSSVTSLSIAPTGQQVDDWLIFTVETVGGNTAHRNIAGAAVQVVAATTQGNTTTISVWKKKVTSTSTVTYTFEWDISLRATISVLGWEGGDETDIIEQATTPNGTNAQSLGITGVTPQGTGRVHILMEASNSAGGGSVTFTQPANYTEQFDFASAHASNANSCHSTSYRALPDGSAVGSQTFSISGGTNRQLIGVSILLKPSGGGGTTNPVPEMGVWRQRSGTDWTEDNITDAEAEFGPFEGHISNYKAAGAAGTLNAGELAAVDAGHKLHIYWKISSSWATVVGGTRDAAIDAAADSFKSRPGTEFWVTFHHEPENDLTSNGGSSGTAAQFRAQWQYAVNRFRNRGVTNVKFVWVIMSSAAHPADLDDLWPGNSYVDMVGVQRYINCSTDPSQLAVRWLADLQWFWDNYAAGSRNWRPLKSDGTGDIPFAFTEWGAELGGNLAACGSGGDRRTNRQEVADAIDGITAILGDLATWGVKELRYFDAGSDFLEPKPSADAVAFQNLKDATEAGVPGSVSSLAMHNALTTPTAQNVVLVLPTQPTPPPVETPAWYVPTGVNNPNNHTTTEVYNALVGRTGSRRWSFRYELLNASHVRIFDLDEVLECTVTHQYLADVKRQATFTIRDLGRINYLSDRIRPWIRLHLYPYGDDDWVEWPMGVFLLTSPTRHADEVDVVTREVEGYDPLQQLGDDVVTARYSVAAGANVVNAAVTVITGAVPTILVTRSTETLTATKEWPPGTSKRSIANELLSIAEYESVSFDGLGRAIIRPYQSPDERPPMWDYAYGDEGLMVPEVDQELDLFSVPNRVLAVVSQPDQPMLVASATNSNPASPTSTVRRGRTIVEFREQEEAATQTILQKKVNRYLFEHSQIYEHLAWSSSLMPFHGTNDVYTIAYDPLAIDAKYSETSWTIEMTAGVPMRHEARRVVSV